MTEEEKDRKPENPDAPATGPQLYRLNQLEYLRLEGGNGVPISRGEAHDLLALARKRGEW